MKLIIINGSTGIGKSTVAQKIHESLPLSFLVDIDAVRRYVSGYREHREESRQMSLGVSEAMVEALLKAGNDIVVDKFFANVESVDRFIDLGRKYNADVYEFILNASKEFVIKRAEDRGYREGGLLTPEKVVKFWEDTQEYIPKRQSAIVVNVESLSQEEVYQNIHNKIKA